MTQMQVDYLQKDSRLRSGKKTIRITPICGIQWWKSQKKSGFQILLKSMALRIIDDLLSTDAKLHRSGFHHHQMSSVDTLFDVAGSLALLDRHGFFDGVIYGTPPVLGSGFTRIAGGRLAVTRQHSETLCRAQDLRMPPRTLLTVK